MSQYIVNDETIRLNAEVAELSAIVKRASDNTEDLWNMLRRKQIQYADDMEELGMLKERLRAREQELADAIQKGLNDAAAQG